MRAHLTTLPATAIVTRDPETDLDLEFFIVEELPGYNAREGERVRSSGACRNAN